MLVMTTPQLTAFCIIVFSIRYRSRLYTGRPAPSSCSAAFASSTFSATSRGEFTVSRGKSRGAIYIRTRGQKFTGKVPPKFLRGVPTRGIEGKRFLDAGARSINENYPRLLTAMIRRWEDTARKSMK